MPSFLVLTWFLSLAFIFSSGEKQTDDQTMKMVPNGAIIKDYNNVFAMQGK